MYFLNHKRISKTVDDQNRIISEPYDILCIHHDNFYKSRNFSAFENALQHFSFTYIQQVPPIWNINVFYENRAKYQTCYRISLISPKEV